MKLAELFDVERQKETGTYSQRIDDAMKDADETLDAGMRGYVKKDEDPHMVNKKQIATVGVDEGYKAFVELISKEPNKSNPYFPRVYKVTDVSDDESQMQWVDYKLEKLEPINEDEQQLVGAWLRRVLSEDGRSLYADYVADELEMDEYSFDDVDEVPVYTTFDIIIPWIVDGRVSLFADKELVDAIKVLNKAVGNSNHKLHWDLHLENMMKRRGKYGIQVVITDPFIA